MQIEDPSMTSYKTVNKVLHWLIAVLVLTLLIVGFVMPNLPSSLKPFVYTMHKSFGVTLLFLMVIRIIAIFYYKRPSLPAHVTRWEYILSRMVQYSLYVLLILMPLSGWIMSSASGKPPNYFYLFSFPLVGIGLDSQLAGFMRLVHGILAFTITGLITLHILGALKHYFIDKDRVLQSML